MKQTIIHPSMAFNKKIFSLLLFLYCCSISPSCKHSHISETLQEGDLLFQNLNCGELCDAIESVTDGVNGKDFSHCGIVIKKDDTLKVLEAIGDKVQINSLQHFFARSGDTATIQNITVGRLKHEYEHLLPKAILKASEFTGQAYDNEFILNNNKWYCSELIYESFKQANNQQDFFKLEPMTFQDPTTKQPFPAWVKYYKELNKEIPEGQLGINPGLISRSDKINIINFTSFTKIANN